MVLERFKQGPPRNIKFEPPCHLLIRLAYLYLYKKILLVALGFEKDRNH
jgi:hypothetical protein